MKKKFFVLFTAFVFIINAFGATNAQAKPVRATITQVQTNQLAGLLPASDAVITVDMQRLMSEAVPQILSSKPQILDEIKAKLDEIQGKTGIDLRQFEKLAVGVSYKKISDKETDFEPVILARGKFNASAFLGVAKVAAKGKYREEQIGDKTVYVFATKEILAQNQPQTTNPTSNKLIDRLMKSFNQDIALTSYDANTLVIGTLPRVTAALAKGPRVAAGIVSLVNRKPSALISFGANMPSGLTQFIDLDNDEIGKNLKAVTQMYGSLDFNQGNATIAATAKTQTPEEAQNLEEMLSGLQMLGKGILSGSNGADKQLYGRLLDKAVISRKVTEISLDLQIPQTDVNALMGILLK